MYAIRSQLQRAVVNAARRGHATTAPAQGVHNLSPKSAVPPQLRLDHAQHTFKDNWLSDPSTYPILVIMGTAIAFMFGMGGHALAYYKDVRISPDKKHTEVRTWGDGKMTTIVSVLGDKNPYYRPTFTEGLGINHEEWVKAKEAAEKK